MLYLSFSKSKSLSKNMPFLLFRFASFLPILLYALVRA